MTETVRRNTATEPVIEIGRTAYPVIQPDSSVGAGLQIMLAAGLRSLRNAVQRAELNRPDTVHRFRVGLRRLRSLVSAFGSVLPEAEHKQLGARLAGYGKRYSRPREWDVFLTGTLRPMALAMPDEPALLELDSCARDARRRAMPGEVDLGREVAAVAEVFEAATWLRQPRAEFAREWDRDLKDFATDLLAKNHRRLRKRLKDVNLGDQHSFHQVRIRAKKIRYPIEMFSNLFDSEGVDAYLDRLIRVQDALGQLNDALIARSLAAELSLSSRSQGLINGWLAREIEVRRARFPDAAKKMRKAEPFWED
jgi:CHAD domain-containing protein